MTWLAIFFDDHGLKNQNKIKVFHDISLVFQYDASIEEYNFWNLVCMMMSDFNDDDREDDDVNKEGDGGGGDSGMTQ